VSYAFLVQLASIVILGVLAQWIAHRTRWPAILLLLLGGVIAGPITGFLTFDQISDEVLEPFVSLGVAIILFEGAANLRWRELRTVGRSVLALVTVGAAVTWIGAAAAGYYLLALDWSLSLLLGAILVVTGPTVILPILAQLRLAEPARSMLKWEAIVIDPIGAILAVLVFESYFLSGFEAVTVGSLQGTVFAIAGGLVAGLLGAAILLAFLRNYLIPDPLQNPFVLAILFASFVVAEFMFAGAGLIAATILGYVLANQTFVPIRHIIEFKENLRVLVLSGLFIVLGARLEPAAILAEGWPLLAFFGVLVVLVRPLSVFLATARSKKSRRVQLLLAATAPRGVVAAAVTSVFALRLSNAGLAGAERLLPIVFAVILGSVALYSVFVPIVARGLKLAERRATGMLIVGAQTWVLQFAKPLHASGFHLLLVDTNPRHVVRARAAGLPVREGNALSPAMEEDERLEAMGYLFACTPNDEVNALACQHLRPRLGREHVFQIAPARADREQSEKSSPELQGRFLFGPTLSEEALATRIAKGERFHLEELKESREIEMTEAARLPLVAFDDAKHLIPLGGRPIKLGAGSFLLSLGPPQEKPASASTPSAATAQAPKA
jgi:NhaP-type Na+/H+ or K+/H+ antiporter